MAGRELIASELWPHICAFVALDTLNKLSQVSCALLTYSSPSLFMLMPIRPFAFEHTISYQVPLSDVNCIVSEVNHLPEYIKAPARFREMIKMQLCVQKLVRAQQYESILEWPDHFRLSLGRLIRLFLLSMRYCNHSSSHWSCPVNCPSLRTCSLHRRWLTYDIDQQMLWVQKSLNLKTTDLHAGVINYFNFEDLTHGCTLHKVVSFHCERRLTDHYHGIN